MIPATPLSFVTFVMAVAGCERRQAKINVPDARSSHWLYWATPVSVRVPGKTHPFVFTSNPSTRRRLTMISQIQLVPLSCGTQVQRSKCFISIRIYVKVEPCTDHLHLHLRHVKISIDVHTTNTIIHLQVNAHVYSLYMYVYERATKKCVHYRMRVSGC